MTYVVKHLASSTRGQKIYPRSEERIQTYTSPSIQIEFEDFYLYRSRIGFLCARTPRIFLDFLKYLSIQHKTDIPPICHIILELFADCKCCTQKDSYKDWMTVCLQLSASLRRIEFGLGENSPLIARRHPSHSVWILPRKEKLKVRSGAVGSHEQEG